MRAACVQREAPGGAANHQQWHVRARSRLARFNVDDGLYDGELELGDAEHTANFSLDPAIIEQAVGRPAADIIACLHSDDKHVRKRAKLATRGANAHFNELEGRFLLRDGPRGLTVYGVPQRTSSGPAEPIGSAEATQG